MIYLGIDPGPKQSALCVFDGETIAAEILENAELLSRLPHLPGDLLIIEKIASYGMAVGEEVFETVYWSGRFHQAWHPNPCVRIPRLQVKTHLCHDSRAKDANIRQALIDRFGKPGTKKAPGATYGLAGDMWAALAVTVTAWDWREVAQAGRREAA